jgi:glycosyltransferase involved in cell wall biosynthesis
MIVGGPDVDGRIDLMRKMSDEFHIIAVGTSENLHSRFHEAGYDYFYYSMTRYINPFKDMLGLLQLWNLFRRLHPHIVHTFDTKPNVVGRLAARLANVPIIIGSVTGLGSLYTDIRLSTQFIRMVYQPFQKFASNLSDLTIFHNRDDFEQYLARKIVTPQNATVISGSGIKTDLYDPDKIPQSDREQIRAELGISHNSILVTMVARLIRSKGIYEFMGAAKILRKRYPYIYLLLVGPLDNESVDRLTPEAISEIPNYIIWQGERRDITQILAATDIFVLPSYREGIPRVLLEAASMGLPLVATDVPGCREVVENGVNGFLVPPRNVQALAQAIEVLVDQPELRQRFGRSARQKVVKNFDISIVADQMIAIYRELLARKRLLAGEAA